MLKRSQNIGYVAVLSKNCTTVVECKFVSNSEQYTSSHAELIDDWHQLTSDPTTTVDYTTIKVSKKGVFSRALFLSLFNKNSTFK